MQTIADFDSLPAPYSRVHLACISGTTPPPTLFPAAPPQARMAAEHGNDAPELFTRSDAQRQEVGIVLA